MCVLARSRFSCWRLVTQILKKRQQKTRNIQIGVVLVPKTRKSGNGGVALHAIFIHRIWFAQLILHGCTTRNGTRWILLLSFSGRAKNNPLIMQSAQEFIRIFSLLWYLCCCCHHSRLSCTHSTLASNTL